MPKSPLTIRKDGDARKQTYSYKYYGYGGYSRDQRPRRLNKGLVLGTILFALIATPSIYFWHDYQIGRLSSSLLEYGDAMAEEGKWREASDAYFRVWDIKREPELLGKLAPAYDKYAVHREINGVIASYQRAIGGLPDNLELRYRLAELLLKNGQNHQALEQADKILAIDETDVTGLKWRALSYLALARLGKPVHSVNVLNELKRAFIVQQKDLQLGLALANYIRRDLRSSEDSELTRQANAVVDRLVAASPDDPNAHFARYQYRLQNGLPGAERDLDQAVMLSPDNPAITQQAAWQALGDAVRTRSTASYLTARELFTKLTTMQPTNSVGYQGLGDTEYLVQGDVELAIQIWQKGCKEAGGSLPLLLRIAEGQTNSQQFDAAEKTLADVDQLVTTLSSQETQEDRNWGVATAALYRAKILLARDQPLEAITNLQLAAELGAATKTQNRSGRTTAFQALMLLGESYTQLGQNQQAATAYDRALDVKPQSESALVASAEAWASVGDLDRAIARVRDALAQPNVSSDVNRQLAQLLFENELAIPSADRNWKPFEDALNESLSQLSDSWKLRLLDVDYSIRRDAGDDRSQTLGKLLSIEQDFPDNVDVWTRLPLIYESIGERAETDRTLNRLEELTSSSAATKILLTDILLGRQQLDAAQKVLDGISVEQLTGYERWSHDSARLRVAEAVGDIAVVERTLLKLSRDYPGNPQPIEKLLDLRNSGASKTISPTSEELIESLKSRQDESEATWQYFAAREELGNTTAVNLQRLREYSTSLLDRLPYWTRTQELVGRIALLEKQQKASRDALANAMSKPSPNVELYKLLIRQYLASSDYLAIVQLLEQRRQIAPLSNLLRDNAWAELRTDLEFKLAPANTGGEETEAFVWSLVQDRNATASEFLKSHPQNIAALMIAINETNDAGQREQLLADIRAANIPSADDRAFVLGQAEFAAGNYETGLSLLNSIDPNSSLRLKAELYASDVRSDMNREEAPLADAGSLARQSDLRLEAIMRLRRSGRNDLAKARQLLGTLVNLTGADANDRVLFATALERLGESEAAERQLVAVTDVAPTARNISRLVDFMLRHGHHDEARTWIEQLEEQAGQNRATVTLRARWLASIGREADIVPLVETYAKDRFSRSPSDVASEMREIAEIYRELNLTAEARHWLDLLASRFPDQAEPLSLLLIENDETEKAIERSLAQLRDNPGAEQAALLARILLYGTTTPEMINRVMPMIEQSLEDYPESPSLLFAAGNLHLKLGDRPRAIKLLQRVTDVKPGHYLAWNNLAALLAEEDGRQEDAMVTIEKAIDHAVYEIPTLVDTKAVVLMHQDRFRDAVDILQQQVTSSQSASDPRYYFHLAMGLEQLGEIDESRAALDEAENLGLETAFLTEYETQQLERLRDTLAL